MAEGKTKKGVTVQVPEDISVDSVVMAIRARGSEDNGVKVCSVKKIKDYILEKEPSRDIQLLNKRLKEALILGCEENVIKRPTQQLHAKPDLRGSFQVSAEEAEVQNNKDKGKTAAKTNKKALPSDETSKPNVKMNSLQEKVKETKATTNPVKTNKSNRKNSKKAIISDDEESVEDTEDVAKDPNQDLDTDAKGEDSQDQDEIADEEEEENGDEENEDEENEDEAEDEEDGEEEEFVDEEEDDDVDESPSKEFLPSKVGKGRAVATLAKDGKESKAVKGRKL